MGHEKCGVCVYVWWCADSPVRLGNLTPVASSRPEIMLMRFQGGRSPDLRKT